jgi:hypothetical protein
MTAALSAWDVPHRVPYIEAADVKLEGAALAVDAFHDEMSARDRMLTGVAALTIPGPAPDARDAVMRQTAVGELLLDAGAELVFVHGDGERAKTVPPGRSTAEVRKDRRLADDRSGAPAFADRQEGTRAGRNDLACRPGRPRGRVAEP